MKKIYFLLFTFIGLVSFGQSPIITTILDGDCSGGNPKLLEIYADGTVDFTLYSLENQTNANTMWDNAQDLSSLGTVTDAFVYVTTGGSADGITSEFPALASAAVLESNTMNLNGDDRIRIILTANSSVIDQYGVESEDGTGMPWEYKDGYSTRINGTGPDGGFVATNWTYNNGSLDGLGVCQGGADTFETIIGGVGVYSTTGSTTPSLSILSPSNGATIAPGTTSVNLSINVQNFNVGATSGGFDGHIHWTINSTDQPMKYDTNDETLTVADGQSYTVFMQLVDNSHTPISPAVNATVTFNVLSVTTVANIAALRAGTEGEVYQLTGEALITYQQGFRNQKVIEDATGGILIDDTAGAITTTYAIGDGVTGVTGELGAFGGMMQFIPVQDSGAASSTGNTLTPQAVTLADLTANAENYESELVMVTNVTMDNTIPNFDGGEVHAMSQGADMFNFRSTFYSADYASQGAAVPTVATDITGIINERNGGLYFLTARDAADFSVQVLSTSTFETAKFSLYPNPTNTGSISIASTNSDAISVQVFDILGKQVKNETLTNNTLNVANLKSGIYIVKITQNNTSTTKKLVIK